MLRFLRKVFAGASNPKDVADSPGQFQSPSGHASASTAEERLRQPSLPDVRFAQAQILSQRGRHREAHALHRQLQASGFNGQAFLISRGWTCYTLGLLEDAETCQRQALSLEAENPAASHALAEVLFAQNRATDAMAMFERAIQLSPQDSRFLERLGAVKWDVGDFVGAEACARRSIAVESSRALAWSNLGLALASQQRWVESDEAFMRGRAVEVSSTQLPEVFVNQSLALFVSGRLEEACRLLAEFLPRRPDPRAHSTYALALLSLGKFAEGWQQYEFRWFQPPMGALRAKYPQPIWQGQPLAGKTIMLRAEQGFGDILQFARFAKTLRARGAQVILQVHKGIESLAPHFDGVHRAFTGGEQRTSFDYYINMMSLPRALQLDVDTIPADIPYLRLESTSVAPWQAAIGAVTGLKVGLAWAGNPMHLRDRERSIPLRELSPLWDIEGVAYVSLQKEVRASDKDAMPPSARMLDLAPTFADFVDAAAVVSQLDLVICVDTAIAHLAGALGKPVWLLLPAQCDFRWMREREDSPWYPTMRLFRQGSGETWVDVIRRVKECLTALAVADTSERAGMLVVSGVGTRRELGSAFASQATEGQPAKLPRVSETRHGIFQYVPQSDDIARSLVAYGEYLEHQLEVLAPLLPDASTVVELGSGIGAHAVSLAQALGDRGHLIAYEPERVHRYILSENLRANDLLHRVSLLAPSTEHIGDIASFSVDELELEQIHLLKFEAPFATLATLQGAANTLWRCRPIVTLCITPELCGPLCEAAKAYGYRCWLVESPLFRKSNFYHAAGDLFNGRSVAMLLAIPEEREDLVPAKGLFEER